MNPTGRSKIFVNPGVPVDWRPVYRRNTSEPVRRTSTPARVVSAGMIVTAPVMFRHPVSPSVTTQLVTLVPDGDTGWRNITGLLINGWTAGQILLTREGKWCHLQVYVLDGTASTSNIFLDPTAGFSANSNYRGALFSVTMAWQRMITPFTTANKPVAALYGTLSWVTTAAWPTTLPGTPA